MKLKYMKMITVYEGVNGDKNILRSLLCLGSGWPLIKKKKKVVVISNVKSKEALKEYVTTDII